MQTHTLLYLYEPLKVEFLGTTETDGWFYLEENVFAQNTASSYTYTSREDMLSSEKILGWSMST